VATGKMGSVHIRFWDGQDEITSRRALRKVKPCPVCHGDGFYSFPEAASVDLSDGYYECDRCDGKGFI